MPYYYSIPDFEDKPEGGGRTAMAGKEILRSFGVGMDAVAGWPGSCG